MLKTHHHPKVGWSLTGLGALMMALSIALILIFDISGVVLHNVLQIGGLALVVVGTLFIAGVFYRDRSDGDESDPEDRGVDHQD